MGPRALLTGVDDLSFRVFVESVRDYALLMLDPRGHIISWNSGAGAIKGYDADEIIGQHFSVFYPPESVERGLPAHELELADRDGRFEDEGWRVRKDGTRFWANVVITALRGQDGKLMGFAKVTRDLTERRRHEEALRFNEVRFRTLVESVRDYAIFMLDPDGDIATWNAGAQQIHGFSAAEMIGTHFSRLLVPDGTELGRARRELQIAHGEGRFQEEGWRLRKDGSRFWASVVITAIRDQRGALLGYSKITRDLTERRRAEVALRESEERFRLLVESVVDYAIVTLDEDGLITSWNSGAERINRYGAGEIIGRHFSRLFPPEDIRSNKPWRQLAMARERGRVNDESWRIRSDGTQYWASNVIAALPESESRRRMYYMVTQDLSQRRHAETLADTAQRMHEFIAMLAHELRNPLAPIRNAVVLMARRNVEDPLVEAMRLTIDRQSQNLTRIVDELLDVNRVARGQFTIDKQSIDLRDVLARAVETSRPVIDARSHRLHVSIADEPIDCFGDPLRLAQVVVNILNNAAKYTPDGGDIWLSARRQDERVELRVRDTGRGIARDLIDRVFDLFMQVDPNAGSALGGLGVGLALVRRIVELHGGTVQATSEGLGKGSEFIVRLPLAVPAGRRADDREEARAEAAPGRFKVLVIDDNVDAANSLSLLLQSLGHTVRATYDGPSGIAIAQDFSPDVVMLDIGMPVMNGYEVARALRAASGDYALVAVTGWGHEAAKRQAREAGFDYHLVKPAGEAELGNVLSRIAHARRERTTR
ncbi:MAG TPA: PAS domain S-box protein [Steroidobacteraceae bacterium]|nr:PAS domain S-box protein [Steroidobacteraceae bacterium]